MSLQLETPNWTYILSIFLAVTPVFFVWHLELIATFWLVEIALYTRMLNEDKMQKRLDDLEIALHTELQTLRGELKVLSSD